MTKPFSVSHTKLATFRRCKQQYHWKYVNKYYPPSSMGQLRGTCGHRALASWHVDYDPNIAMQTAFDTWVNNGFGHNTDWQLLEDALNRYFVWSKQHDTFDLIVAEQEFSIEYEGYIFGGFIDGIVKENDQQWLLENKFYKRMDNSSKEMDQQSTIYLLAAHLLGYDVQGIIYNQIRMADTKVAITEPVVRQRVFRNSAGLSKVEHEIAIQVKDMQTYEKGGMPYRNMTRDCHWDCPFYNACLSMLDDGQEPTEILETLVKIRSNNNAEQE